MTLLISRSGIAAAAGVQRPVVSMWQKRTTTHGLAVPFPEPVRHGLFDLDEVIAWQARSGRGANPAFGDDAALYAVTGSPVTRGVDPETALIALAATLDVDLRSADPQALVEAARSIDPEDTTLLSEVAGAAADADLRELAHRKIEAAYGPSEAIEALVRARARSGTDRVWTLSDAVVGLVASLCHAFAPHGLLVVDGVPAHPGDLALGVAIADPERSAGWRASHEAAASRVLRRRALAAGVTGTEPDASAVVVAQVPHRGSPDGDPVAVLRTLDECVLTLEPSQVAVLVGPAAVLCDALGSRGARLARADVLRTGRLRAAVRLPRGLVVDKPRAELGLWVVGDADPAASIGDRLLVTGDVSGSALRDAVVDGLVSDLVAALYGVDRIRARAFAHCTATPTARVLATDSALVSRAATGVVERRDSVPVDALTSWQRAQATGLGLDFSLATSPSREPGRTATIGELVAEGAARLLPGRRVPAEQIGDGSVRLIGPHEVAGGEASRGLDPLMAHAAYALTEPGDVVFVTRPRPRATVDEDGGAVVAAPARVLRLRTGSPHAAATAINALPERASGSDTSRVETWRLPIPAPPGVPGLDAALRAVGQRRRALAQELAVLDELESDLVGGVTSGALVVTSKEKE